MRRLKRTKQLVMPETIHNYDTSAIICGVTLSWFEDLHSSGQLYNFYGNGLDFYLIAANKEEGEFLRETITRFPLARFKLLLPEKQGVSETALLNRAISESNSKYLFFAMPGCNCLPERMQNMRRLIGHFTENYIILNHYPEQYVSMADPVPGMVLMTAREDLINIGGFDTELHTTELAMINLQARLDMIGRVAVALPVNTGIPSTTKAEDNLMDYKRAYYPKKTLCQIENGTAGEIGFRYDDEKHRHRSFSKYMTRFQTYTCSVEDFGRKYKIIILAQSYNEADYIKGFLDNVGSLVNGIILLDDESTDDSYKLAVHDKLLVKAIKKRERFDDLGNRNLLLDIASFFDAEWFCFMDIDERFDERYCNFSTFTDIPNIKTVGFYFIHLWEGPHLYNANLPDTEQGLFKRLRMFRNIGRMQILSDKTFHFSAVPYYDGQAQMNILVHHLGNATADQRNKKYKFYEREDALSISKYDYLLQDKNQVLLRDVKDLKLIQNKFIHQPQR